MLAELETLAQRYANERTRAELGQAWRPGLSRLHKLMASLEAWLGYCPAKQRRQFLHSLQPLVQAAWALQGSVQVRTARKAPNCMKGCQLPERLQMCERPLTAQNACNCMKGCQLLERPQLYDRPQTAQKASIYMALNCMPTVCNIPPTCMIGLQLHEGPQPVSCNHVLLQACDVMASWAHVVIRQEVK